MIGVGVGLVFVLAPVLLLGGDRVRELLLIAYPLWSRLQDLATTNLRASLLPFALVLLCFCWQLRALVVDLAAPEPPLERIIRREQLLDLSASLFFGIGVIWTAIGMRNALLYGLAEVTPTGGDGAFSILQRLIEGGILVALSSTIVGGAGGYLMRVLKSLLAGPGLNALYLDAGRQPVHQNTAALRRIEALLAARGAEEQSGQ